MTVIRHAQRQHSTKRVNAVNSPAILPSVVVPSDAYFKYTSLLLPGSGTNNATNNTFLDSSTNNFTITRNGNTSQGTFSPYGSNWSNYFDGVGDYLNTPSNAAFTFGTGDLTLECWIYQTATSTSTYRVIFADNVYGGAGGYTLYSYNNALNLWKGGSEVIAPAGTITLNVWNHVAWTRSGSSNRLFINGTQVGATTTDSTNYTGTSLYISASVLGTFPFAGYITNVRAVKGTAVYTTTFTPPSVPLTAIANTSLLTCQSNRFIDNSTNNFTITRNGDTNIQRFSPFSPSASYSSSVIGGSAYFDGTGDYLTIPYSTTAFDWWTTDYTLEAWVFASSWTGWSASTTQPALIGNFAEAGTTNYWCFGPHSDGTVKFNYWNGSTSNYATSSATVVLNQWNHIAFTKTSSGIIVWVNGVGNTVTAISGTPQSATAQPLTIGKTTTSAGITGYVSNIRIVKGTAVYTSNFTPPTAPLTAIANTSLLTCADNRLIDDSTNNFTITKNGDVSVQRFSPFSPAQAYSAGTIGGSGYFDGTGDYLTTPADAAFTFGTGNLTLECWIYQTATSASTYRVIFADNVYGNAGGYTLYSYNNALNLWKGGSGGIEVIAPAGTIALNTWTHVAWTRSGSSNRLFINGIQVGATTTDATNYTSTASYIGASQTGTLPFIGYISDVRIVKGTAVYTTNFTPSTTPLPTISGTSLLLNYTNAGIIDNAMMNNLETVGDAKISTAQSKFGNSSMSFDGTGDYLTTTLTNLNYAFGSGDFTIEFWVYFNAFPSATWMVQLSQYVDTNNRVSIFFGNNATNENGLVFKVVTSSTVYKAVENDSASITMASLGYNTSTWYHVAITRSGSTIKGFINGTQKCTTTTSATFPTLSAPLLIGSFDTTPQFTHNGYIDDLRITKGYARYTSNFTPPTAALETQ